MLNCLIVDDEPLAREIMEGYIKRVGDVNLAGSFHDASEAKVFLEENKVDLLFLDIEMPEISGIELLKSLRNPPVTVFTTAYRNYAFEGYELGVIDFLLKPVSFARFSQSLGKAKDFVNLKNNDASLEDMPHETEYFFVKSGTQKVKLYFTDITHVQGLKDYAIIHCGNSKTVVKGSIKSVLQLLPEEKFIRVHKSFIVAKEKIRHLEKNKIIFLNHEIPVGRHYKNHLETTLLKNRR